MEKKPLIIKAIVIQPLRQGTDGMEEFCRNVEIHFPPAIEIACHRSIGECKEIVYFVRIRLGSGIFDHLRPTTGIGFNGLLPEKIIREILNRVLI